MSENAKSRSSLVIRLPNWVGDAVMATPALRSMRLGYPEARICLVGKAGILQILEGLPYYNETYTIGKKGVGQTLAQAFFLRSRRFDMGLLLPNSFSAALAFFLGGVKARTGYALNGRSFLLNRKVRPVMAGLKREPSPMTQYYLDLAIFAGGGMTDDTLELRTVPALDEAADRYLNDLGLKDAPFLLGLNPGASFGPSKLWTPQGFARVADRCARELKAKTILLCGPGEEEIADAILARAETPIVDTSRRVLPLDMLKSMIARLSALVTTDTGPRHFAAALGVPVLVVMGPTDPRYTQSNLDDTRVIRVEMACSPCHKKVCDTDHECMERISGDQVFEALVGLTKAVRSW